MAVRDQDSIKPDFLVLPQVVSEVGYEFLIALWEVTWINQRFKRASAYDEAVSAAEGESAWIFNMKLDRKVCQSLPSFS